MAESIFRNAALERLSTPEQLDRLVRVSRPVGWVALLAFFAVCVLALVWSTLVALPVRVAAQGMLVAPEGVVEVMTASRGRVVALLVQPGERVKVGQVVARLDQPEIAQELELARLEQAEFEEKHTALARLIGRDSRARGEADTGQRSANRQAIAFKRQHIAWLEQKVQQERDMETQGFISRQRAIASQIELNAARSELATLENEPNQLEAQAHSSTMERQRSLLEAETRRNAAQRKVAELQARLARQVVITSPYAGEVAELKVNRGELVEAGVSLFSVQRGDGAAVTLMAVVFVAPEEGKRLAPGMSVQVSPSTVKREEYGFIQGHVSRVASVPATPEGMMRVLKNRVLADRLAGSGAPFEVWIELERDPNAASGLRWSSFHPLLLKNRSQAGPAQTISSNTLCQAQVTVREQRLITFLIPGLEPLLNGK